MANFSSRGASALSPLHKLSDYKVADDNLDVRGWEVIGADGKRLGTVDDLIVDKNLLKVRYLDIDVDRHLLLPDTDARHILVPIGVAQIDEHKDQVFVTGIEQASLVRYPFYKGGVVDPDYEYRVMHTITSPNATFMSSGSTVGTSASTTDTTDYNDNTGYRNDNDDFYNREQFDDSRFYRRGQTTSTMPADTSYEHSNSSMTTGSNASGTGMRNSVIEEDIATIERLKHMLDQGIITHEEFTALKRKAIGI